MKNTISKKTFFVALLVALAVPVLLACTRYAIHRLSGDRSARAPEHHEPIADLGAANLRLSKPAAGAHRLILDGAALARLADSAQRKTQAFQFVSARADEALKAPVASGYQGFEWADAVADLSLMWLATNDARYADGAVRYLHALLDDQFTMGDGKGGADVVTHDSGYGMRTFGAYTALGYDWLRDAPGMNAALKAHVLERLDQWINWYGSKGYLNDHPISNYYWGYLTALSFSGIAAAGEAPQAEGWLQSARDKLANEALPALRDELTGGGWPEGWQYGEYTMLEIALVAKAFETGVGVDVVQKLPWLAASVTYHAYALLPDDHSVYDGGTWGEHPAKPSAQGVAGAIVALDGKDEARTAEARWLMNHALPPLRREQSWAGLLADRSGAPERSPRDGAPTSHFLAGQGLTFARNDWSPAAVWTSFQAGPLLSEDHQDADQGHFEMWRGSDALLVDGGDSEGSATINHNTLLVDDHGRHLNYPPNQGVWGRDVKTTRFGDDGFATVAVGDIGEAYAPSCADDGCKARTVRKLVRTFAYVRPSVVVVDDEVELENADDDVTWAAHLTVNPTISESLASAVVGSSRVDVRTLLPNAAQATALHEPTPSGEGSHRADHPWGPMWRLEVKSPRGSEKRRFLHFISVDRSDAAPPPSRILTGDGLNGCAGTDGGARVAVLFADSEKGGRADLGQGAKALVVGLSPGKRYLAAVEAGSCRLNVARSDEAAAVVANPGGFVVVNAEGCGKP